MNLARGLEESVARWVAAEMNEVLIVVREVMHTKLAADDLDDHISARPAHHNYIVRTLHIYSLGAQILLSRFSFFFLGDFGSADDSLAENLPDRAEALGALET